MINGFEEQTSDLKAGELKAMAIIASGLKSKIGQANAVTNKQIRQGLKNKLNIDIKDARVRKIINHIRLNKIVPRLVASSKGYYIENDEAKLNAYVESLTQRAASILAVAESLK